MTTTNRYNPLTDLALLVASAISCSGDAGPAADRIAGQLGLGEDDPPEQVAAELRKALGLTEKPLLTPRELDVVRLIAEGLTNKEAAGRLGITKRTVDTHLEHVRAKTGLRTRMQIANWLREHGSAQAAAEGDDGQ